MEYFPNFPPSQGIAPDVWAAEKEAEGWHGVCASDHLWVGNTRYPHVFVAATQMAMATERVQITTSFCNNLFRSPVEFAQAALSLQSASNGRFEAGLGAGWAEDEIVAMGGVYPPPGERISKYLEALQVARALIRTGQCQFEGEFYNVDISGDQVLAGVTDTPPPLVASAGGPRALRESTPLVDRIEVKASARSTRGGFLDFSVVPSVTEEEVRGNVDRVKDLRPELPIGVFLLVGAGTTPAVDGLKQSFGNGYLGRFVGHPEEVAEALEGLAAIGIERVQLTELVPGSVGELAPLLVS